MFNLLFPSIDSKSQDKSILTKTYDLLSIPQVLYMLVAQAASLAPAILIQALGPVINNWIPSFLGIPRNS